MLLEQHQAHNIVNSCAQQLLDLCQLLGFRLACTLAASTSSKHFEPPKSNFKVPTLNLFSLTKTRSTTEFLWMYRQTAESARKQRACVGVTTWQGCTEPNESTSRIVCRAASSVCQCEPCLGFFVCLIFGSFQLLAQSGLEKESTCPATAATIPLGNDLEALDGHDSSRIQFKLPLFALLGKLKSLACA
eukprot:6475003-Amphidinium_carterae.2